MTPATIVAICTGCVMALGLIVGAIWRLGVANGTIRSELGAVQLSLTNLHEQNVDQGRQIAALEQAGKGDAVLEGSVDKQGRAIARIDAEVQAMRGNLDQRYDSQRAAWARVDDIERRLVRMETRCEERYGGITGRHFIGPTREGGGDDNA